MTKARAVAAAVAAAACFGWSPALHDQSAPAAYRIAPDSRFDVVTGKAGLLGRFGHEHRIRARSFTGTIVYNAADPSASSVEVTVPTAGLHVVALGADREDAPDVEKAMREDVLHVDRWPTIEFRSTAVEPISGGVRVTGDLTMAGRTRPVTLDMRLRADGRRLVADGAFTIRQTDWGIEPYRAALGTIRVADRVTFELHVVGLATP